MVRGDSALEIYMSNKYLFPYDYLDDAQDELNISNKYNIYYVLKANRRIVTNFKICDNKILFSLKDLVNLKTIMYAVNLSDIIRTQDLAYVNISMHNNRNAICITYNDFFMECYNKINNCNLKNFSCSIHYTKLISLDCSNHLKENVEDFELLYIGQTKKNDIYNRLYNHNTIPTILRDLNKEDDKNKYELYILVSGVHVKRFTQFDNSDNYLHIITSNSLKEDFLINKLISKNNSIDLAEAMLILFFKPKYNKKLKNSRFPENLETYNIFKKCNINPITYSLDLYFEHGFKKLILYTNVAKTFYKQNIITCEFTADGKIEQISLDHLGTDDYV